MQTNGQRHSKKAHVRRLLVQELGIDKDYQRELNKHHVTRIQQGFDERQLGLLEVSKRRDNWYAVFDGQHRLAVLRLLGIKDALCLVHEELTPQEEAHLFSRLQLDRKTLRPYDRFRAQLFAGEPQAVEIDQILRDYGFRITAGNTGADSISAVAAVEAVYARAGGSHLRDVLHVIREVWDGDRGCTVGEFLRGLSIFWIAYGPKVTEPRIDAMRKVSPTTIMRRSLDHVPTATRVVADASGVALELRSAAKMKQVKPVRFTKVFGVALETTPRKRGKKAAKDADPKVSK